MIDGGQLREDQLRVSFADDINPLLAEAFLEEAPIYAHRLLEIVGRLAGDSANFDDVVQAQRVTHSLKGSASITGVTAISSVTHQAEDILDWLADSGELPSPELRVTLVETADCVAAMVDALCEQGPLPRSTQRVLKQLHEWRERQLAEAQQPGAQSERDLMPAVHAETPVATESTPKTDPEPEPDPVRIEPNKSPVHDVAPGEPRAEEPVRTEVIRSPFADALTDAEVAASNNAASAISEPVVEEPVRTEVIRSPFATASPSAPTSPVVQETVRTEVIKSPVADAAGSEPPASTAAQEYSRTELIRSPRTEAIAAHAGSTSADRPLAGAAPASASAPAPSAPAAANLRVSVTLVDRLLRLASELAITNVQALGAQQRMTSRANQLREQYHLLVQRLGDLQDMVEIRSVPSRMRLDGGAREPVHTDTIVTTGEFDPLELDQYNELHSKNTALAEAVTDFCELALGMGPELISLEDTIADQQRVSKDFSDTVLSARMVPVGIVTQRLERTVREACRETNKQASLEIVGGDIPVDGDVLNTLVDPLLHLLRNAVDHGIETPAQRERAGKNATALVEVRFARDGENVLVQVRDDGAGFDVDGIRETAQQRGLLANQDFRADRELLQLTVSAGFSTRSKATQLSGRGIGMDVVQRAVLDLKGSMDIDSVPGAGATISMRVPLTLISMHVLLVRAGSQILAVPSGALKQLLITERSALNERDGELSFSLDEQQYDVRRLDQLIGRSSDLQNARKQLSLLLLEADAGPTAIVIDEALDGRYLVVNSLGERVPRPRGVIGACILGDGGIAPVLDLRELLRRRSVVVAEGAGSSAAPVDIAAQAKTAEVLVVDDSLTARRMLSIAFGDAGYRVRTAIDGLDAIDALEDGLPDLLVTDLEMPRMNGLELTAHLRGRDDTVELPILMVTSRSTEKHRGQAQAAGINDFITKPYSNEDLIALVRQLLN